MPPRIRQNAETRAAIREALRAGELGSQIAIRFNVPEYYVRNIASNMATRARKPSNEYHYEPSETEIAAACEAYQSTWSDTERRKRCVYKCGEVETVTCASHGVQAMQRRIDRRRAGREG